MNNNNNEKDVSQQSNTQSQSTSKVDEEEIITQLTLAGLKVLMVRKQDQIIYKLSDNMQVSSIAEEQRQQLMKEIQSLHAATMAAAANAQQQQSTTTLETNKPIAPKILSSLDTPPQPTAAEADAMKETARKLREELEQQQQMQLLLQSQGSMSQSVDYDSISGADNKTTRKYNKTGKYSKKKQQQAQQPSYQQFIQHLQQGYPQQQSQSQPLQQQQQLTTQQLLNLQQSLQQQQQVNNVNTSFTSMNQSSPNTPLTANSTAASSPASNTTSNAFPPIAQAPQQDTTNKTLPTPIALNTFTSQKVEFATQPNVATPKTPIKPATQNQIQTDSILSKRLPEEELQHREIKKRFMEALLSDRKHVTAPDYKTPFKSLEDAINRLLPYHIYQYPKRDLDSNNIPLERQDNTMIEIFKCQAEMFDKHSLVTKTLEKNKENMSLKVMIGRQVITDQRQKLSEEQSRIASEQAAQQQELLRIQAEKSRLAAIAEQEARQKQQQQQLLLQQHLQQQQKQIMQQMSPQQALEQFQQQQQQQQQNLSSAVNQALLQNPQFVNYYSQLSPESQQRLLQNRDQLIALFQKQQLNNTNNNQ